MTKEPLAQPEQKSVAMADYMALTEKYVALKAAQRIETIGVPVGVGGWLTTTMAHYTWVGLTDEEIKLQWSVFWEAECHPWAIEFARAIEAKLKEKNT